jgi:hypothetical protein
MLDAGRFLAYDTSLKGTPDGPDKTIIRLRQTRHRGSAHPILARVYWTRRIFLALLFLPTLLQARQLLSFAFRGPTGAFLSSLPPPA